MRLHRYFSALFVAGTLAASPMIGLSQEQTHSMNPAAGASEERTPEVMTEQPAQDFEPAESFEVAVTYCYLGSVLDESTGEIFNLYGLCEEEATFDVA